MLLIVGKYFITSWDEICRLLNNDITVINSMLFIWNTESYLWLKNKKISILSKVNRGHTSLYRHVKRLLVYAINKTDRNCNFQSMRTFIPDHLTYLFPGSDLKLANDPFKKISKGPFINFMGNTIVTQNPHE